MCTRSQTARVVIEQACQDSSPVDAALEASLYRREAFGLRIMFVARLAFGLYALVFTALAAKPNVVAILLPLTSCALCLNVGLLAVLVRRRPRHLRRLGLVGSLIDVLLLIIIPQVHYHVGGLVAQSPAVLFKGPMGVASLTMVVLNGLALRPLYPLVVTCGSFSVHMAFLLLGLNDPRTVWTSSMDGSLSSHAVSVAMVANKLSMLLIGGGAVVLLTWAARRLLFESAQRQAETTRLRQAQAEAVLQGRLRSLGQLVAGLSHEMNTPLGAVGSAVQTTRSAVRKLRVALADGTNGRRNERTLRLLEDESALVEDAVKRLQQTVAALKNFANHDQAELRQIDLNREVEATLALVPKSLQGEAQVVRELGALRPMHAYVGPLNQSLLTLLTNAFEATTGKGQILVHTEQLDGGVQIRIADTGHGMSAEQQEAIFDIGFSGREARISAGFGLAACQQTVERHGGRIEVQSAPGQGTTFTITLPQTQIGASVSA